jgi:hypothetical protein
MRQCMIYCTSLLLAIVLLLSILPSSSAQAQADERCFPETGHCISGRIREFWEENGGLPIFGLPLGPEQEEFVEGKQIQVQWFERNRLELHPENPRPYDVLLGRLGVDRLEMQGRDWQTFPKGESKDGCLFFEQSGHSVCPPFLDYWRSSGLEFDGVAGKSYEESLALFGLPIGEPQTETVEGKEYTVQWFERARFEYHPENQPPYDVLLGLLGADLYPRQPATFIPPSAAPNPGPAPLPIPNINIYPAAAPPPEPAKAALSVVNNTDAVVRLSIAGPTTGQWSLAPGQTFQPTLEPGAYQTTITASCGGKTESFTLQAGEMKELPVSCAGLPTAHIKIINSTGGRVSFGLSGPLSRTWYIEDEQTLDQQILPGDYQSTVVATCGGKTESFSLEAGAERELTLDCQSLSLETATVRVVNSTGGVLRFSLAGPTAGSWSVADGQVSEQHVRPGEYQITIDTRCGQKQENFNITDNEKKELTYGCTSSGTATVQVMNNGRYVLTVGLNGPTSGSWSVRGGETFKQQVLPGHYTMTVSSPQCVGLINEEFDAGDGELLTFSYGCG